MIVVEITAGVTPDGATQTFYLSDYGYVTEPTDTPANQAFEPALKDPGSLGVSVYSNGRTGGQSRFEIGDLVVTNQGGVFDNWINYGFDGRQVVIRQGNPGDAYPSQFTVVLRATVDGAPEATLDKISLNLRDQSYIFEKDALTNKYGGTNVLPAGVDGSADIKGTFKPRIYGKVKNIAPILVNTSKLIYQLNDGPLTSIDAIYDRGASPFTFDADHATNALLQAATVAAGHWATCKAEGLVRVGSKPDGLFTADATASGSATVAGVLAALATGAGATVNTADVTALDAINSAVVGIFITDGSVGDAMDQVSNSIGAWYAFDGVGNLRLGVLTEPEGDYALQIEDYEVLNLERNNSKDVAIPAWAVSVKYGKNYNVQDSDLAGVVTSAARLFLGSEFRTEVAEDASIKLQYLLSTPLEIQTLLFNQADAASEAARQLALYKVRRDIFEVTCKLEVIANKAIKLMDVISLTYPRFGLNEGKKFRLLGLRTALKGTRVTFTLWG